MLSAHFFKLNCYFFGKKNLLEYMMVNDELKSAAVNRFTLYHRVERLPQRQKLNFRHVPFLCDSCVILRERKTAADYKARKAAARHTRFSTTYARASIRVFIHECRKTTMKLQ